MLRDLISAWLSPSRQRWRPALAGFTMLLAVLALAAGATTPTQAGPEEPGLLPATPPPDPLRTYLVRVAEPSVLVVRNASTDERIDEARERQRHEVAALLQELAAAGQAGAYGFDTTEYAFQAELTRAGRDTLAASPLVAAVEPWVAPSLTAQAFSGPPPSTASTQGQGISSVSYIQVHSPFMWGKVSDPGLTVTLTLESSVGITKGVPTQLFKAAPNNYVKIDREVLYFETLFVDPDTKALVMIAPGDKVHVVTSGVNPRTGLPAVDDRRITVYDVRAWTSYERDVVTGWTNAPAGTTVVVSHNSSSLSLSQYITSTITVPYSEVTVGSDGGFAAASFRTSGDATYQKKDLVKGQTGYVRVVHADDNETYTVHGQMLFVLENSYGFHGYAFPLPTAPTGLADFTVPISPRPYPSVKATLKSSSGGVKSTNTIGTGPTSEGFGFYWMPFSVPIVGGDIVEAQVFWNQVTSPINQVQTAPLSASVDLGANQVVGTGPAGTEMVVGAGRVSGYLTSSSNADFLVNRVPTNSGGSFTSGQFPCGSSTYALLKPGSFGYAGYEDARGNFIYVAFAAPASYVLASFPYVEGWMARGPDGPTVTVLAPNSAVKHQAAATPQYLWMVNQKLVINTFYIGVTSQFIEPGDTVRVASNGQTAVIPVDKVTAFANTDTDTIAGEAPTDKTVRVVPANDRSARREVVADARATYSAGSPFAYFNNFNCSETTKDEKFTPGNSGRAFVRHEDGNEVFAVYGRSMHVQENENYAELYVFARQDLDWWDPTAAITVTVTLTRTQGPPVTMQCVSTNLQCRPEGGRPGKVKVNLVDSSGNKVIIRAGDSLAAVSSEGLAVAGGPSRPVTLAMNSLALLTGSPDVDADTLAGVGPRNWPGQSALTSVLNAKQTNIPASNYTAYSPVTFVNSSGQRVDLVAGNSGLISFSDSTGHRLYTTWAATSRPVKITGWLWPGDLRVCGTAAPGTPINIHDVTAETQDVIIGVGITNDQGTFCVQVDPSLWKGQVVMADGNGTFSQPVVVGGAYQVYLMMTIRQYSSGW